MNHRWAPVFAALVILLIAWGGFALLPDNLGGLRAKILNAGLCVAFIIATIVLLMGTTKWRFQDLGLLVLFSGTAFSNGLDTAVLFGWTDYHVWEVDLIQAFIVIGIALVVIGLIHWLLIGRHHEAVISSSQP